MINELKKIGEMINKLISDIEIKEKDNKFSSTYFSEQGKKGAEILKQKYLQKDPDYYKKIGAKGVEARKKKSII